MLGITLKRINKPRYGGPSTGEAEAVGPCEFLASLVYKARSRAARAVWRGPFSKLKQNLRERKNNKQGNMYIFLRQSCMYSRLASDSYITKADFKLLTLLPLPPDRWLPMFSCDKAFLNDFIHIDNFFVYCVLKIGKCHYNSVSCKKQFYISCSLNFIFSL